jgi:hypothetical protein
MVLKTTADGCATRPRAEELRTANDKTSEVWDNDDSGFDSRAGDPLQGQGWTGQRPARRSTPSIYPLAKTTEIRQNQTIIGTLVPSAWPQ